MKKSKISNIIFTSHILIISLCPQVLFSKELKVYLEKLPPLVENENSGYLVTLLKAFGQKENYKIKISTPNLKRSLEDLVTGVADIAGTVDVGGHPRFLDVPLNINIFLDYYALTMAGTKKTVFEKHSVATLRGNEELVSSMTKIPKNIWLSVNDTKQLIKLLLSRRIEAFYMERGAVLSNVNIIPPHEKIYYRQSPEITIPLGLLVQKGNLKLKRKLAKFIGDNPAYLESYTKLVNIGRKGVLTGGGH